MVPVLEGDTSQLEAAVSKGEGRTTLRLKKDGQAVVEEVVSRTFMNLLPVPSSVRHGNETVA